MRGLSGAVTALILVVASVVIALIVVGFAFNLFGSFGSAGAVSATGTAYIYTKSAPAGIDYNSSNVYLQVTMNNRGPNTNITSASINGLTATVYKVYYYYSNGTAKEIKGIYIPAGQNQLVIEFAGISPSKIAGSPVNIQLVLSNGQTVYVAAAVNG